MWPGQPPVSDPWTSLVPRVCLVWAVPALVLAAGRGLPDGLLAAATLIGSGLEAALWACHQRKDLRLLLRPLRFAPFPLRLFAIVGAQLTVVATWTPTTTISAELIRGRVGLDGASSPFVLSDSGGGGGVAAEGGIASAAAGASSDVVHDVRPRVGRDLQGQPFDVDADPATLSWDPKTISVILPCAEEREYALKTVKSVFENTPRDVLHEIIVVDDGSNPPLSETHLTPDVQRQYNTKVLRHGSTIGLIGAKKTGGDAATGDISVFFDCHVAPVPKWHEAFIRLIGQNYRRLVVPQITALDIDTWMQQGYGGGMAKCYLTWDADFKWFDSDDMYVAVISGGLLGMSRRWWFETGGYDEKMLGWGGENLDQSLRVWLCGGEIVAASDSFVAHMWRTGDKRTVARYWHVGDSGVNRARAVYAWYGDFAEKLKHYPSFNRMNWGSEPWYGNLSNIHAVKERLNCRPFEWFLRRFKSLYEDAGMIPQQIFMLREEQSKKCLRYDGYAGTSGNGVGTASLSSCDQDEDHRMYWHIANKQRKSGRCCAGVRAWNTDQCLQEVEGRKFQTAVCDVSGRNILQEWALHGKSGTLRNRDRCAGVEGGRLVAQACSQLRAAGSRWTKVSASVPLETQLYTRARKEQPEVFASAEQQLKLVAKTILGGGSICDTIEGGCFHVYSRGRWDRCLDESAAFTEDADACALFFFHERTLRLTLGEKYCLDRSNDNSAETWTVFACHGGENQQFQRYEDVFCNSASECLSYG